MDSKELDKILTEHKKWVWGDGGSRANLSRAYLSGASLSSADLSRADLSGANLSRAYLSGASLSSADLSRADLSGANLSSADLSRADLSGANLSRAYLSGACLSGANLSGACLSSADLRDTIYDGVNWLHLIGIVPDKNCKARAYKVTNANGEGPYNGGINYTEGTKFSVPEIDKDKYTHCSYGINLANLAWCLTEYREGRRLFLMEFSTSSRNCVCPIGSDGKFRVKSCVKIGECNWKGELLK